MNGSILIQSYIKGEGEIGNFVALKLKDWLVAKWDDISELPTICMVIDLK